MQHTRSVSNVAMALWLEINTKTLNKMLMPFCFSFAANVDSREWLCRHWKKGINISIPATGFYWFYWEKLTSLHLIYWQQTNLDAWQRTVNILMPPKIFSFPTFLRASSLCYTLLATNLSHKLLHGWWPYRAVRLHLIYQTYCHAKSEQTAHCISFIAV